MIKPENFKDGTPEKALALYLEGWKERDWNKMLTWTQKSWVEMMPFSEEALKARYYFKIIDYEIVEMQMIGNVAFSAKIVMKYEIARGVVKTAAADARAICEIEPMVPAPNGEWGVNPTSVTVF